VNGVVVYRCGACGEAVFPRLLLCGRCGGADWLEEETDEGVLEEVTTVAAADVRIGSVRSAAGPMLVARVEGGADAAETVRLRRGADGAVVAYRDSR
jgi:uncharacterized OB-fold protein